VEIDPGDGAEVVLPDSRDAWRSWLEQHHDRVSRVWLVMFKKASGKATLDYDDAVEEGLCFGWVDSLVRRVDDERYIQLFTPRKTRSPWAPSNKERVGRLLAAGKMAPAGVEAVEAAKRNGTW
jgi:uncharacterized protein YdeI (YjbR/CyaY-like superfamily)